MQLIGLAAAIIEAQTGNNMTKLDLSILCIKEAEELGEEEKRLVDALLNSSLTQLEALFLQGNTAWFRHDEAREYLIEFIKSQTMLAKLSLYNNDLSSETKEDLEAWKAANASDCKIYF